MWITLRSRLISVDIKGVDEMKREYVKPVMMGEAFVANEYVASCYRINCNVPGWGSLWAETNGISGLQKTGKNRDTQLVSGASACNKWHNGVIQDNDPVANGYWVQSNGGTVTPVYYWKEDLGTLYDYHATRMDKIEWEKNPNAS